MTLSRPAAQIAGLGLLAMAVLAMWANFAVFDSLIIRSDPAGSVARLIDSGARFPLAIAAFWAVAALDVVVALALWALLRPRAPGWAAASAVLRLVYTAVLVAALVPLTRAPGLLDPAAPEAAMAAIGSFNRIWLAGLGSKPDQHTPPARKAVRAQGLVCRREGWPPFQGTQALGRVQISAPGGFA